MREVTLLIKVNGFMLDRKKDPLELVLYFSIFSLIVGLLVSVYFYNNTFPGGISIASSDWSALGSFFGGIFAPAVSFVTLVAIIITIRLQKKFLETQIAEFSKLHTLQLKTIKSQDNQLFHAKASSEHDKITSYKQTLLAVVAQQIDFNQKIIDRCISSCDSMSKMRMAQPLIDFGSRFEDTRYQQGESERKIYNLAELSISIAVTKYKSVHELDQAFADGYGN